MIRPIVFAAGLGTRMGSIKALIPIDDKPALAVVLNTIASAGLTSPFVVLGRDAEKIGNNVDLSNCQIIVNDHPEKGLSGSMRLGLNAVRESDMGILTFLVDMPFLAVSTVCAVLDAIERGASLAAPFFNSTRGFPVFFQHCWLDELGRSLKGDRGGRQFLAQHDEQLIRVPVEDPGCTFDIDRPGDLRAWKGERLCVTKE